MPNIVAHSYVASEVTSSWQADVLLGSTLPDFAKMYRAQHQGIVAIKGLGVALDRGIACHERTDAVFDSQPEKPEVTHPLTEDLQSVGLPYHAARLSAAFAADVLIDTRLIEYTHPLAVFEELSRRVLGGMTSMDGGDFSLKFADYVKTYFKERVPRYYRNPKLVAEMIERRLASRSADERKIVRPDQVRVLAEVIDAHTERAGDLGMAALERTVEIMCTETSVFDKTSL